MLSTGCFGDRNVTFLLRAPRGQLAQVNSVQKNTSVAFVFRRGQCFGVSFFSSYPALILHFAHLPEPAERELKLVELSAGPGIHWELPLAWLVLVSSLIISSQPWFLTQLSQGTTWRELNIRCAQNLRIYHVLMACTEAR